MTYSNVPLIFLFVLLRVCSIDIHFNECIVLLERAVEGQSFGMAYASAKTYS